MKYRKSLNSDLKRVQMLRLSQVDFFLIAILIIGFTLRVVGIGVGLPDYPDPRELLIVQDIRNLIQLKAPPQIFNWPGTAWFYLVALIGKILGILGLDLTVANLIWLARFINVLLSTGTIWLTYRTGSQIRSRSVGLIAAALLTVTMLHATNESRFALVDIPATFCVTLLLCFCINAQPVSFRRAVWLGILIGIGFAVKFTTAFAGLAVVGSLWQTAERERHSRTLYLCLKLGTVLGGATVSFTVICPYWFIDLFSPRWNAFFEAFFYEASHYHQGHFGLFATQEIGWFGRFTYLWTLLRWGMGGPLAFVSIVGLGIAIGGRKNASRILTLFVVPYLLFVGWHKLKFARHLLLIYPALAVFAAVGMAETRLVVAQLIARLTNGKLKWVNGTIIAIFCGVGIYSLVYTAGFASVMTTPSTISEATEWLEANIPPEERIEREPEILFKWLQPKHHSGDDGEGAPWALVLMPNAEVFMKYAKHPDGYSAVDWYPIQEPELDVAVAFYERVFDANRYELVKTFRRHPQFLGISVPYVEAPFPMRALAHPEIRVYRLRE